MKQFFAKLAGKPVMIAVCGAVAMLAVAVLLLIANLIYRPAAAPVPASVEAPAVSVPAAPAAETVETKEWKPEIATNEYWDYGKLNNLKLYVNNTDRGVIYALDPETGKTVWTIWGKDYGFTRFEIWMTHDHLFISRNGGASDKDASGVWVFDGNGRLAWEHHFLGYIDMPQMLVTPLNYVVLENRSGSVSCLKGCGVMCSESNAFASACTTGETWAFDLATGAVVWVNRVPNYYGWSLRADENGNITSYGGGWGGYDHYYVIDGKTGDITSHIAVLKDQVNAGAPALVYDQSAKTVSYTQDRNGPGLWQAKQGSTLYKLVSENTDTNGVRLFVLSSLMLLIENKADGSGFVYAADVKNGNILWKADLDQQHLNIMDPREIGDTILLQRNYISVCKDICNTCTGHICLDTEPSKECKACRAKEEAAADFTRTQYWSLNRRTGAVIWRWHYGKKYLYIEKINFEKNLAVMTSYGDGAERRTLDLKTGTDRAFAPDDLPPAPPPDELY